MIDLAALVDHLALPRDPGPAADAPPLGTEGILHAAISVVARPADAGPEILLIKRAVIERDPWSGHVAFPGGKHEASDRHLPDTAVRETREETGLVLPDCPPEWIGRLPGVAPRGPGSFPPLLVTPFLFRVGRGAEARVASPEVEDLHWVALTELIDPGRRSELRVRVGDGPGFQRFPTIEIAGEQVWGLTWRVLDDLLRRLE